MLTLWLEVTGQSPLSSFWTVTFPTYGSVCLEFFPDSHFWNNGEEKDHGPVFINMKFVSLLAAGANSLFDSFSYMYSLMFMIANLIEHVWDSWYLIIWLERTVHSSGMDFWTATLSNWIWEVIVWNFLFLDSCFRNHLDRVILQIYKALSNQSLKYNFVHISSLNLTPKLKLVLHVHH